MAKRKKRATFKRAGSAKADRVARRLAGRKPGGASRGGGRS